MTGYLAVRALEVRLSFSASAISSPVSIFRASAVVARTTAHLIRMAMLAVVSHDYGRGESARVVSTKTYMSSRYTLAVTRKESRGGDLRTTEITP